MNLTEAITGRPAVHEYTAETVDESTVTQFINAAMLAKVSMNEQPWKFTVLRNRKILDQISEASKALILKTTGLPLYSNRFQSHLEDPDFQIFYHAPVLIMISANTDGFGVLEDCALAAENLMLAACAAGFGTSWVGLAQNFLNSLEGKRLLGVPPDWISVAPIIVGHPKTSTPAILRKKPEIFFIN